MVSQPPNSFLGLCQVRSVYSGDEVAVHAEDCTTGQKL
jgi:hypothetical protein